MSQERRMLEKKETEVARRLRSAYKNAKASNRSITQEWVAEQADTKQPLVAQYMNGQRPIGTDVLFAMCKAIGVNPAEIDPIRVDKLMSAIDIERSLVIELYSKLDSDSKKIITDLMGRMISPPN